ncbi:MAG TPA: hypothetical protein P5556_11100 [Candidatus Gastranaerophilales bacterium]|nr:hypothetical protein [Candidatus Gastranaerophilales bacterium]
MRTIEKNGHKLKEMSAMFRKAGQGIRTAADVGYKTGYFIAKHPNIEKTKDQIQKNYKVGLITLLGIGLTFFGITKVLLKMKTH